MVGGKWIAGLVVASLVAVPAASLAGSHYTGRTPASVTTTPSFSSKATVKTVKKSTKSKKHKKHRKAKKLKA